MSSSPAVREETPPALGGPLGWHRWTTLGLAFGLLAAATALGAAIFFFRANDPFTVDVWWNALLAQNRSDVLLWISYALNWLGGGWFGIIGLPVLVALAFALARRPWAIVAFLFSEIVSALLVQALKHSFGRARPEDIVVVSDYGSFPSGHVANATTIAIALMVLFPRLWVAIAGAAWVLVMAISRTLLGAHWPSDTLGGALVGAAAVLLMVGVLAGPLQSEARKRMDAAALRVAR